jgi:hypothetical protein
VIVGSSLACYHVSLVVVGIFEGNMGMEHLRMGMEHLRLVAVVDEGS